MTYKPNMNDHWKLRAIAATRGSTTMMGAVVLAIMGHVPPRPPYFKGLARIDAQGVIHAKMRGRRELFAKERPLMPVQAYTDELKRLAELCQMDDSEARQLMDEGRKWIERDARAVSRLN